MGRIRDLVSGKLFGGLKLPGETFADVEQLEAGFDLSTNNLGRAHFEVLENHHENRGRSLMTVIPKYNACHDPHLRRFRTERLARRRRTTRDADGGGGGTSSSSSRAHQTKKGKPSRAAAAAAVAAAAPAEGAAAAAAAPTQHQHQQGPFAPPSSAIVSTRQVLELKKVFYNNSEEPERGRARALHTRRAITYACTKGRAVVQEHLKLHCKRPQHPCALDLLHSTLLVLEAGEAMDWPTYLLVCTTDIGSKRELRKLLLLKEAHSRYLLRNPVDSERGFLDMVVHLNGSQHLPSGEPLVSLFQAGDFYHARGEFQAFPEAAFSLFPFFTQVYILRARGRGTLLTQNFLGHTTPGNVGGRPDSRFWNNKRALFAGSPTFDPTFDGGSTTPCRSKLHLYWLP